MELAIEKIKQQLDTFSYEIEDFEKNYLFPEIISRLEYIKSHMIRFQKICDDAHTATLIDESVRQVVNPMAIKLSLPEPGVGVTYLQSCKLMIQESFIDEIDGLTSLDRKMKAVESISSLARFFSEVNHLFRSISDCEEILFKYSLRNFVNIRNSKTGVVLVSPPEHLEIILVPFEVSLKEISNVSKTSIASIESWSDQVRERKRKYLELLVNVSQIQVAEENFNSAKEEYQASIEGSKASKAQAHAAKIALYFQVAVIFFSVILLVGSYKLNIYLDKLEAENAINSKLSYIGNMEKELTFLKTEQHKRNLQSEQLMLELKEKDSKFDILHRENIEKDKQIKKLKYLLKRT